MNNILGFCSFVEDGVRLYGCRGTGKDYDDFYRDIHSTSYKCAYEDFPWDYFTFTDPQDERNFLNKYSSLIEYQV